MIKKIRKRFIAASMLAVTILIAFLLGVITVTNAVATYRQNNTRLEMLVNTTSFFRPDNEGDGFTIEIGPFEDFHRGDERHNILQFKLDENYRLGAVYFTVITDTEGNILDTDLSHILTISEETAQEISAQVIAGGKTSGKHGDYRYLAGEGVNGDTMTYVFMDVSESAYQVFRVFLLSFITGLIGWGIMLLIVIAISDRMIKPIKENYEKQRRFVTDAGHELKTPLAVILSNTEAMEMITGENKWTRNIHSQVERLSGLMQNLLTLAKADEGATDIVMQDFDFTQTVMTECSAFEQGASNRGVTINTTGVNTGITYHGEKEQLRRVVSILLDNAVKYCSENSEITVNLSKTDKKLRLSVRNTCDSLPDCPADKLTDRFYRPDESRSRNTGGNGIGLSAAKSVAEMHRGTLTAEYHDENIIEFTVIL